MTSTISKLSNGIRVVTLNNGAKGAAQVGIFSNAGSGAEATQYVGKMNLLSNAITASNPMVSARTTRQNSAVKTQSTTSGKALNRLASALYKKFIILFHPDIYQKFRGYGEKMRSKTACFPP